MPEAGRRLAAVAPVPARQPLLPEPVVAERLVAALAALALGEPTRALERARAAAIAGADEDMRRTWRLGPVRRDADATRPDAQQQRQAHANPGAGLHCESSGVFLYSVTCPSASSGWRWRCARCSPPRRPRATSPRGCVASPPPVTPPLAAAPSIDSARSPCPS